MNFNYDQAIRQANKIEEIARDMRNIADQKLRDTIESIGAVWQGNAANLYLRHCGGTRDGISKCAGELMDAAGRMRSAARILHEAEMRALEEQRRRDADGKKK
jgi:hypothetical protein